MASKAIAESQKNDGVCAMIDMEHAFDPDFASKLGDKPTGKIETIPTGSLPLDIALGCGGWPRGRIIEVKTISLINM